MKYLQTNTMLLEYTNYVEECIQSKQTEIFTYDEWFIEEYGSKW